MRAVIMCRDYGDYLSIILPAWKAIMRNSDELIVATSYEDAETQEVATANAVPYLRTTAWTLDKAKLNLGAVLDAAFADMNEGDVCLALDADVLPDGQLPPDPYFEVDTIYGCRRYDTENQLCPPANIPYIESRGRGDAPEACAGYFQAFRWSPKRRFGSYPNAATYDYEFAFQFPHGKVLDTIAVTHLSTRHENWNGRVTPRLEVPV